MLSEINLVKKLILENYRSYNQKSFQSDIKNGKKTT